MICSLVEKKNKNEKKQKDRLIWKLVIIVTYHWILLNVKIKIIIIITIKKKMLKKNEYKQNIALMINTNVRGNNCIETYDS